MALVPLSKTPEIVKEFKAKIKALGFPNPRITSKWTRGQRYRELCIRIEIHPNLYAIGYLSSFPGCCGLCIAHDAAATEDWIEAYRLIFELRERMATGYFGQIQHTDVILDADGDREDSPSVIAAESLGWKLQSVSNFHNPNTHNLVGTWVKNLYTPEDSSDGMDIEESYGDDREESPGVSLA